jgi:hypothetical protein
MTLNQLKMFNLSPRGIRGTCVPTSLAFLTGACYQDIEHILVREQPKIYRPEISGNGGVFTQTLLGPSRKLFGHLFTKIYAHPSTLYRFQMHYKTGSYLLCVHKHALVLKEGEFFDLKPTRVNEAIQCAWEVTKTS